MSSLVGILDVALLVENREHSSITLNDRRLCGVCAQGILECVDQQAERQAPEQEEIHHRLDAAPPMRHPITYTNFLLNHLLALFDAMLGIAATTSVEAQVFEDASLLQPSIYQPPSAYEDHCHRRPPLASGDRLHVASLLEDCFAVSTSICCWTVLATIYP